MLFRLARITALRRGGVPALRTKRDVQLRTVFIDEKLVTIKQVYNPRNDRLCAGSCVNADEASKIVSLNSSKTCRRSR